jgi:UDP-2-acetamido-3-amino-2,3-dideoxy-glucuronate N-acetyltransferase
MSEQNTISKTAVIKDKVQLGKGIIVQDFVVIGKRPERAKISLFAQAPREFKPTIIGNYVTLCAGAIVYAAVELGNSVFVGDYASIRENTTVGENTIIGRNVTVECDTKIGKNCKIQTGAHITGECVVGDKVFIGPEVCTTNDAYMALVDVPMQGPVFGDGCVVGANSTIVPGVRIGKSAVIAAGSVVFQNIPDEEFWMGNPAKKVGTYKQFLGTARMFAAKKKSKETHQ